MAEEYSDEEQEEILNRVYDWGVEFSKSKHFGILSEEQKGESENVVMLFSEYMYSYHGLSPEEWNAKEVKECCRYTLPRKIIARDSFFRSVAPALSAFLSFAAERGLLRGASSLSEKVKGLGDQIVKNASDPRYWGISKSFGMAALEAGVDIGNKKEMDKFINLYNERQLGNGHSKQKIGRNDPCPCGSGRKYKRCCGRHVK